MYDLILIRYGEMTLKKQNYKFFQKQINQNIKEKLKEYKTLRHSYTTYRYYIYLNGENYTNIINILDTIPGLHSYSLCKMSSSNYEDIIPNCIELLNEYKDTPITFKVETHRGDKTFPDTSLEISKKVSSQILKHFDNITVDVHTPEVTLSLDVRYEGTFVYTKVLPGLGGLPYGESGKGLLMMSGGIDSPVAGYLAIKKGIKLYAIHFASPPHTSIMALQKVIDLVQILSNYTADGKITLFVVPFTKIQEHIRTTADNKYLITIMRRMMYKIATMVCEKESFNCIINGESIGQVASQTLESIQVVNEVTNMPIIRPLATYDKNDIIKISRKINTYDTSIVPFEDCCTVFVPEHPIIKPQLKYVLNEENKGSYEKLITESINNIETYHLNNKTKLNLLDNNSNKFEI